MVHSWIPWSKSYYSNPAKIRLDENVFCLCLQKTFSRSLDQDVYIRFSHTSSVDVFKISSKRLGQDQYNRLGYTSSRCLQDVFKTSSRYFQDVFKTFSRHFESIFKKFSRHLQDVLPRRLQDDVKTYHQVKVFLLTRLPDLFNTFLRCTARTVLYRRIYPAQFRGIYGQWTKFARVLKISQDLVFHFTTPL